MQQTIDINLIKENPQLFFSQLNMEAENEFINLLEYFIFKYEINISAKKDTNKDVEINDGFKVFNKIPRFILNPIEIKDFKHFSREELHER